MRVTPDRPSLGPLSTAQPPARLSNWATEFWQRFRLRLTDRRFWTVQAMIGGVTVALTVLQLLEPASRYSFGGAYFVPASLYFFPVLYASLNFGKEGAIPTALWSALLAVPNLLIWHTRLEVLGEAVQMTVIVAMASLVAWKVDEEANARRTAEELERQRRLSELKYRSLFDVAGEACLVLHQDGTIQEANKAAVELFGRPLEELKGAAVRAILGVRGSELLKCEGDGSAEIRFQREDRPEVWMQPICTVVPTDGGALIQAVLKDVTQRRYLEDFTGAFVSAEELHRQRLSHELYDVSLQALVVLWRNLEGVWQSAGDELPEAVGVALLNARESAGAVADQLRRFSRDLCPTVLNDLGLAAATRRLVDETSKSTGLRGKLTVAGSPRRLNRATDIALFRVAEEALRNVRLHAEARRFSVQLVYGTDIQLTVTDDGKGFEVPSYGSLADEQRLGLLGMYQRAVLARGSCRIVSRPGKGTCIQVRVPADPGPLWPGTAIESPEFPSNASSILAG